MRGPSVRPIVIAAGGTGGHFFPAVALASALVARGQRAILMTDRRTADRADGSFEDRIVLAGGGIAGRGPARALAGLAGIALGTAQARRALSRLRAAVVVGFGGYPSVAPALAARSLGIPVILHEQNAVLGRANRALARLADRLALSFPGTARVPSRIMCQVTGNPVRPDFAFAPYEPPSDELRVLVLGGSLGARVLSDVVPAALELLASPAPSVGFADTSPAERGRTTDGLVLPREAGEGDHAEHGGGDTCPIKHLSVTQQCRPEDLARVSAAYDRAGIEATLAPFFADMPARLAAAHLVIGRAGASTCAELAVVGRPAILIPLPGAIDDHQAANAAALPATVLPQPVPPERLAEAIRAMLPRLPEHAAAMAAHGRPHAADDLADLVLAQALTDMPAKLPLPLAGEGRGEGPRGRSTNAERVGTALTQPSPARGRGRWSRR